MKTKSPTPATDTLKRLHRFLTDDPAELTDEQVAARLEAEGIDAAQAANQIREKIRAAITALPAA
jgi:hypothetical protein